MKNLILLRFPECVAASARICGSQDAGCRQHFTFSIQYRAPSPTATRRRPSPSFKADREFAAGPVSVLWQAKPQWWKTLRL